MYRGPYRYLIGFHLVIERLLISGSVPVTVSGSLPVFQSRYRAASHFRCGKSASSQCLENIVSISLSSGFSFQVTAISQSTTSARFWFPSRYRAASHFRDRAKLRTPAIESFNLVIERLLISGTAAHDPESSDRAHVSISLSSGFSFQDSAPRNGPPTRQNRFNLVIERLLISGLTSRSA